MEPGFRERLQIALEAAGIAAEVVITQNRTTMLSVRGKRSLRGTRLLDREVRIARQFADLGAPAIDAIVAYVADAPGASARVHALIRQIPGEVGADRSVSLPGAPARRVRRRSDPPLRSRGLHHDLAVLGETERARYFPTMAPIPITWGRREPSSSRARPSLEPRRRRQLSSIRLGSYEANGPYVRIHSRLDDPRVPGWFIGFVIFHELLHHALGIRMSPRGDRRELHPAEFREAEARHERYAEALAWEEHNITALLSPEW